jgi:transposase, IS30 family
MSLPVPDSVMDLALAAFHRGASIRGAAKSVGICRTTLMRRLDVLGIDHSRVKGQGRIPDSVTGPALVAYHAGEYLGVAAAAAGISEKTLSRRLKEQAGRVIHERKQRPGSLTLAEREEIRVGIVRNETDTVIGTRLGRSRGAIGREIAANGGRLSYRVHLAQERAEKSGLRPKQGWIVTRPVLWGEVQRLLREKKWSPEQISQRLRRDHPNESFWWVSHEAIYDAIYVQCCGELRKELIKYLRMQRPRRQPQGRAAAKSPIKNMVNISLRPTEVMDRVVPGHWEGDLIIGQDSKSAVATLIERTTRKSLLIKVDSKLAEHVAERVSAAINQLPDFMKKTLTWDQGTELAAHATITAATNIAVYFCDPHSPWQRPTNENFNGLARQFLPKGTDLSVYTQDELNNIAELLNERPRKVLSWDTPNERFAQLVATTT